MPMMPDQIKVDHCYRMTSSNRRKIIVHVLNFAQSEVCITEDAGRPGAESFSLKTKFVRFKWRSAAPGAKWSGGPQQLSLAIFALHAEAEVGCDLP